MILRQFLYSDTACASYLFGCLIVQPARRRRPPRRARSTATSRPPTRPARRSWRCSIPTSTPTMCRACPTWSPRPARRRYLPAGAGVEFAHQRARRRRAGRARQHHLDGARDARARARPPRLRRRRSAPRTGRALARLHRRLAARERRRPTPTCTPPAATRVRSPCSSTPRCSGCSRCPTMWSSCRATTAARCAAAACPAIRSRASASSACTTAPCSDPDADGVRRGAAADLPPAPTEQARIVAANRAAFGATT